MSPRGATVRRWPGAWWPGLRRLSVPEEHGRSPSHRRDWTEWKALLKEANIRDGRLHDARHTAATVLLILGVPERAVMGLMGWSTTAMAARYQHMVDAVRADVAKQVDDLIWRPNGQTTNSAS